MRHVPHGPRGRALAEGAAAAGARPKIYVYEGLHKKWRNSGAGDYKGGGLYGLEMALPALIMESPYVTNDPAEADYFYVYAHTYSAETRDLKGLIDDVKSQGPWWDRKAGKDHIFTIVNDQGGCDNIGGQSLEPLENVTRVVHYGKMSGVLVDNPCSLLHKWAADCDQVFQMVAHKEAGIHKTPCYKTDQDLLAPSTVSESPANTRFLNESLNVPRTTLIVFGGGINQTHMTNLAEPTQDAGYSFGVRQTFARLYEHHPEVKIFFSMVDDYWQQVASSIFCLAPAGWGWGARVKGAITSGCIPVIIQEGIKVDWEDDLPMHEFAVRMPFMTIHRLPEILHRFKKTGKVEKMQKNLECVWRLYWWSRPHGRAFEMTMCTLKARALGKKPTLDFATCRLKCGDAREVDFNGAVHSV
ncbi:hypothetical protein FOA52_003842 [Chlamydomonas sp. UWO 241]|nr:hypothetical protein FOA52_003842 [Chlamydomonas sp. UWO 241]